MDNIYEFLLDISEYSERMDYYEQIKESADYVSCPGVMCNDCYIRNYLRTLGMDGCDSVEGLSYTSDVGKFSKAVLEQIENIRLRSVGFDFE
ncbi:MAG: hypothetical protein RR744_00360 [Cellulosilyticaceae bacterium]